MASAGSRTLWKGAITFGLVHIPVGLHGASTEQGVDFDWLDKRSMDPVGYKRINKRTGKEIERDDIVKGIEYEDGKYVIISPEEIEAVFPKTTQTIDIQRFVDAGDIPFVFLERPYYVAPVEKSGKVYALLREALLKSGKIGLAKVVIATKQHLAALVPMGDVLVLDLLRWGDEVKTTEGLGLPAAQGASAAEMKMAMQLIGEMSGPWKPEDFKDEFRAQVMKLVDKKVKAGKTETVVQPEEEAPAGEGAEIIDLTELLKRSLKGGAKAASKAAPKTSGDKSPAAAKKTSARKPAAKAPAARKRA
jgi:DNA end-binding protein Ku